MFITFLESRRISEDGFTVKPCAIGVTYDIADTAAVDALRNGWARHATDEEIANMKAAKASEVQVLSAMMVGIFDAFAPKETAVKSGDACQIIKH